MKMEPCMECGVLCPAPRKPPNRPRYRPTCSRCWSIAEAIAISFEDLNEAASSWVDAEQAILAFRTKHTCVRCLNVVRRECLRPISRGYITAYAERAGFLILGWQSDEYSQGLECGPCRHKLRKLRKQLYEAFDIHRLKLSLDQEVKNAKRDQNNRAAPGHLVGSHQ
jgi:hypothetical protein